MVFLHFRPRIVEVIIDVSMDIGDEGAIHQKIGKKFGEPGEKDCTNDFTVETGSQCLKVDGAAVPRLQIDNSLDDLVNDGFRGVFSEGFEAPMWPLSGSVRP